MTEHSAPSDRVRVNPDTRANAPRRNTESPRRSVVFTCPNGCKVYGSSNSERVGHFCRKTNRIAGKHAWLYAYPPKETA